MTEPPTSDEASSEQNTTNRLDMPLIRMEEPPELLHHYTTTAGLLGILESRSLWATDLSFLNDAREFAYGRDEMLSVLRESPDLGAMPPEELEKALAFIEGNFPVFVTCLCSTPDLLSQWRGYGFPGGYSVGFDARQLRQTMLESDVEFPLCKVVYMRPEQRGAFREWLRRNLPQLPATYGELEAKDPDEWANLMLKAVFPLYSLCAQVKDPAFSSEQEWRIAETGVRPESVQYRLGGTGIIPYISLPRKQVDQLPIREIIIGPGADFEQRERALKRLLNRYALTDVEIKRSRVPFRAI